MTFNMNFILFGYWFAAIWSVIIGNLLNLFGAKVPALLIQTFKHGKTAIKGNVTLLSKVPKSWYKHFYILASIYYIIILTVVTSVYILKYDVPLWIIKLLNVTCGEGRTSFVSPTRVYVAVCLMTLQVVRRFHDTQFVSIFGKNSYMDYSHYILGLLHYPATVLAILCEAPKFAQTSPNTAEEVDFLSLTYLDWCAVILFLWAWWHQYLNTKILANLRKNKKGEVTTNDHKLPHGDWFEYISSPIYAAETLIYISLAIILRSNLTWLSTCIFVLITQVEFMLLSHWWYQETFQEMPKNRKAVIPFIY